MEKKARKSKVVKVVKVQRDKALEYEAQDGVQELVNVRRLALRGRQDVRALMEGVDKAIDIYDFNRRVKQVFFIILDSMLDAHGDVSVRDVCAECAYRLNVSVETAKRYVQKYTAPSAPYCLSSGIVRRRPG